MRLLLVAALLILPTVAFAQADTPQQIIPQRTVLDFDGDLVEATLDSPDLGMIETVKRHRHQSLIKVRESFDDRLLQSASKL